MKLNKVLVHASQALCAAIVLWCAAVGCDRREEKPLPEVYPAEGHGYMDDPAFQSQIAEQDAQRKRILGEREKLIAAFEQLEKRAGSRAAAEKLPEWKELTARAQACGRAFDSNRVQTTEIMQARMKRALEDSERIKRGEAKAKKISK